MAEEIKKEELTKIQEALAKLQEREISAEELIEPAAVQVFPDLGVLPPADIKAVDTAYTDAVSTSELLRQQIEQQRLAREEFEKSLGVERGETWYQAAIRMAKGKPKVDVAAELTAAQIRYGVPEILEKVQAQNVKVAQIQGDITKLDAERQIEIDRSYARVGASLPYIRGEVNETNRLYNSKRAYKVAEMSAEAALMQAYQGNLTAARGLVSDTVNAYTYDIQQQRSDFDNLFDIYGDWINSLEQTDRDLLEQTRADLEKEEAQTREDKTNVMNLMLAYAEAGIVLEDTVEEATKKASEWQELHPEVEAPITKTVDGKLYQWDEITKAWKPAVGIPGEPTIPGLEGIDVTSTAGVQALNAKGWSYGDIFVQLTDVEGLAIGAADRLLSDAGIFSDANKAYALADLMESLSTYKEDWAARGDEAGTREEFAKKAAEYFPEFSEGEILDYIYREMTDEWLKVNKPIIKGTTPGWPPWD